MAGYIKQIVLILLALNMSLYFVGLYDLDLNSNPILNILNIEYNETTGEIDYEDADSSNDNWLMKLLGLVAIGSGIIIGLASIFVSDISGLVRAGMVTFLIPLAFAPLIAITGINALPVEFKILFGIILTVMFIFGLIDFFGGVDS